MDRHYGLVAITVLAFASGLSAEDLSTKKETSKFITLKSEVTTAAAGDPIPLFLWIENTTAAPTIYPRGFALTQAQTCTCFLITLPDGSVWSTYMGESDPDEKFMTYDRIPLAPRSSILLGRFNLGSTTIINHEKYSSNPDGYRPFWSVITPGQTISVSWWDGVFQIWEPQFTNGLLMKIIP